MKQYDKKCPICGHMNRHLYLDETRGWMECEKCNHSIQFLEFNDSVALVPVYDMDDLPKAFVQQNNSTVNFSEPLNI